MCAQSGGDDLGKRKGPARSRSWAPSAPWIGAQTRLDPHKAGGEVDVLDAQREQLAEAQTQPGLGDDHGAVAGGNGIGERADLVDGERHDAFPVR